MVRWVLPTVWEAGNGNPACFCRMAQKPMCPTGEVTCGKHRVSHLLPAFTMKETEAQTRSYSGEVPASSLTPKSRVLLLGYPLAIWSPSSLHQDAALLCFLSTPISKHHSTGCTAGPAGKMALAPANLSPVCPRFKHDTSLNPHNGPSQQALPTLFFRWGSRLREGK